MQKISGQDTVSLTYAAMCMTSGRIPEAMRIYSTLRFHVPENPMFAYGSLDDAWRNRKNTGMLMSCFALALENDPSFSKAEYEMAQASIDDGRLERAKAKRICSTGKSKKNTGIT